MPQSTPYIAIDLRVGKTDNEKDKLNQFDRCPRCEISMSSNVQCFQFNVLANFFDLSGRSFDTDLRTSVLGKTAFSEMSDDNDRNSSFIFDDTGRFCAMSRKCTFKIFRNLD